MGVLLTKGNRERESKAGGKKRTKAQLKMEKQAEEGQLKKKEGRRMEGGKRGEQRRKEKKKKEKQSSSPFHEPCPTVWLEGQVSVMGSLLCCSVAEASPAASGGQ